MAIFSKVLKDQDVNRSLSVPETCIKAFQRLEKGTDTNLRVKDESGIIWTFRCRVPSGLLPTTEFYGDWLQYVRSKDLKQGDEIIFSEVKDRATSIGADYKIEARKKGSYYLKIRSTHAQDQYSTCLNS